MPPSSQHGSFSISGHFYFGYLGHYHFGVTEAFNYKSGKEIRDLLIVTFLVGFTALGVLVKA
jgi:hypothetical protein